MDIEHVGLSQTAVLLIDNSSSHKVKEILNLEDGNIFMRYLLRNATADIKSMDQSVIQNLKTVYRRNFLLKLVEEL